jgi:hypothetical protein
MSRKKSSAAQKQLRFLLAKGRQLRAAGTPAEKSSCIGTPAAACSPPLFLFSRRSEFVRLASASLQGNTIYLRGEHSAYDAGPNTIPINDSTPGRVRLCHGLVGSRLRVGERFHAAHCRRARDRQPRILRAMARLRAGASLFNEEMARLLLLLGSLQIIAPTDQVPKPEHFVGRPTRASTFVEGSAVCGGDVRRGFSRLRASAASIAAI